MSIIIEAVDILHLSEGNIYIRSNYGPHGLFLCGLLLIIFRPYLQYGRKIIHSTRKFFHVYLPIARTECPDSEFENFYNLRITTTLP